MDAFLVRKKRKPSQEPAITLQPDGGGSSGGNEVDEDSTDVKLAMLSSLYPDLDQETLLDLLLAYDGSVQATSQALRASSWSHPPSSRKASNATVSQSSLRAFAVAASSAADPSPSASKKAKPLSRKGATLHLYDPKDIGEHTPCTVIHNFLPPDEARDLLVELLAESETFEKITFKLFDSVVSSPHTSGFYVGTSDELDQQRHEYVYNGARLTVRDDTHNIPAPVG